MKSLKILSRVVLRTLQGEEMTQEEKLAIVVEAVLKLYGHIEIRTRRDDELIKLLYEIKRGDEKSESNPG